MGCFVYRFYAADGAFLYVGTTIDMAARLNGQAIALVSRGGQNRNGLV
jgi:hypothetical protein